jgi:hypothetical protein
MKQRLTGLIQVFISLGICSCATLTRFPESELRSGYYDFRPIPKAPYSKVYATVRQDTVTIILPDKSEAKLGPNEVLREKGFDFDLLLVPFKYRGSTSSLPSQLTTDFNGNVFFGYRIDRYKSRFTETPAGQDRSFRRHGVTVGAFGGFGTTAISPWTTNNQTTDEYSGFVFTRGIAAMMAARSLSLGIGLGWDYLADRDKHIWIYQNEPWLGMMLSLNLN